MKIIVDAMGGDNAPGEIVKGAVRAQRELGVEIVLVGRKEDVEACLKAENCTDIPVIDAREVITMEDDPSTATRRKKDASMTVGLNQLRDGAADAMVSAGSTGALLTGATLIVKRIRGIRRAALAPVLPAGEHGVMLIDCGANVECTPEYLLQFAYMDSFYAKKVMGCPEQADAEGRIRFIGNVEGTGVFTGGVDVVVTDGFTGNVLLKATEGVIKYMMKSLKGVFYASLPNKLAAAVLKKDLKKMAKSMDVNEVGGTALVGISKPVIKAHGSSNAASIFAAIRQAKIFVESGIIADITENIEYMKLKAENDG